MNFSYGYGNETRTFQVPDRNLLCEVTQNQVEVASTGAEAVREALKSPIGTKRLGELVRPGQKIAVN